MLVFIEAIIGSYLDDSYRSKIYTFHQDDSNASGNYDSLIEHDLKLDERYEFLKDCKMIHPVNISTDVHYSNVVDFHLGRPFSPAPPIFKTEEP